MNRAPLILAIVLLLLPVLYVGSYLALLQGRTVALTPKGPLVLAKYRIDSLWLEWLYYPLETLDRRIRPNEWDEWSNV